MIGERGEELYEQARLWLIRHDTGPQWEAVQKAFHAYIQRPTEERRDALDDALHGKAEPPVTLLVNAMH